MDSRPLSRFCVTFLLFFIPLLLPVTVQAQDIFSGFSGLLDFNYSNSSFKTKSSSGDVSKLDVFNYQARCTLTVNTQIFPNLTLYANGQFQKQLAVTQTDDTKVRTDRTQLFPFVSLTYSDKLFTAGVNYSRREDTIEVSHTPSLKTVNEQYSGNFSWQPEGLPWLDFLVTKINRFDKERSSFDLTENTYGLTLKWLQALQGLDLRYTGSYDDRKDNLHNLETVTIGQTGRITYANNFLNNRINLNSNYVINHGTTKTSAEGTGNVPFSVIPFGGLSRITNNLSTDPLFPNAALIDGDLILGAGVDIGVQPPPPPASNTWPRNMGLDFVNPTEVNNLLVWVDRDLSTAPAVPSSFLWDVYVSSDNVTWNHHSGPLTAPFGPFQNSFEIDFPNITTRYIKVVTNPLSSLVPGAAAFPNIFVTELQAFLKRPVGTVRGRTSTTSQNLIVDTRTRILNAPYLYHTLSLFYTRTDPSGLENWDVLNSLTANHRFSNVFSGSARLGIEYIYQEKTSRVDYLYDATLTAEPLRTLRHTLVYSGRTEQTEGKTPYSHSIFLNNNAEFYKGIDVFLSGGYSLAKSLEGEDSNNTTIIFGTTIVPHPTVNINLGNNTTLTQKSGGGQPSVSTHQNLADLMITYNPFPRLRLLAEFGINSGTNLKTNFLQNYGINWSPFQDGTLQFNFSYNEFTNSADSSVERSFIPSVRWRLGSRSYLDVSYQWGRSKSDAESTESKIFSATFKLFF